MWCKEDNGYAQNCILFFQYGVCILFLYAWNTCRDGAAHTTAGGNECHVQYGFICSAWWMIMLLKTHGEHRLTVQYTPFCLLFKKYVCTISRVSEDISTISKICKGNQMILKCNENWGKWWLFNTITSLEPNTVLLLHSMLAAMDKTSSHFTELQTLLKMHHTETGEHGEGYMDRRYSSGPCGRTDMNWEIHQPSCIKTQPASSSSLHQNIPRDPIRFSLLSHIDHNITETWGVSTDFN